MKAISIRQPWAWLIVRPDLIHPIARREHAKMGFIKDVENRTWPTQQRGPVLIHAAKGMTRIEYRDAVDFAAELGVDCVPAYDELDRQGVIGRANIVDCRRAPYPIPASWSRWFVGPFGFLLSDTKPLPFIPMKGALGFFDVPDELLMNTTPQELAAAAPSHAGDSIPRSRCDRTRDLFEAES